MYSSYRQDILASFLDFSYQADTDISPIISCIPAYITTDKAAWHTPKIQMQRRMWIYILNLMDMAHVFFALVQLRDAGVGVDVDVPRR